jgi:hypothetical protein
MCRILTPHFRRGSVSLLISLTQIANMPEKILGMSIMISNGRVSELLCQKMLGKNYVKIGDC